MLNALLLKLTKVTLIENYPTIITWDERGGGGTFTCIISPSDISSSVVIVVVPRVVDDKLDGLLTDGLADLGGVCFFWLIEGSLG